MKTVFALYKKVCGGGNAESTGIKTGFWGPVLINQNLQILKSGGNRSEEKNFGTCPQCGIVYHDM